MAVSPTLLAIFLTTTAFSFLSSLCEAVLLSTNPSHVELLRKRNDPSARLLAELKERIDRPLIAILTFNTLVNMFGSAAVGAETARLAEKSGGSEGLWVAVAAAAISMSILVFAEIVPKTLGAIYWKQLASPTAPLIKLAVTVLMPAVLLLEFVPRLISRQGQTSSVTRDELAVLTEMGRKTGAIPDRESFIIGNLLRLNLMRVRDVMTPRVEMFALPRDATAAEVVTAHNPIRFSRIPVYEESVDRIVGLVLRTQILQACLEGRGSSRLDQLKTPVHIVPETKSIASLLDEFIKRREHLFLVVNEYGGTEGVVSLEDVIETLLGVEIDDEMDKIERLRRIAIQRIDAAKRSSQSGAPGTQGPTAGRAGQR